MPLIFATITWHFAAKLYGTSINTDNATTSTASRNISRSFGELTFLDIVAETDDLTVMHVTEIIDTAVASLRFFRGMLVLRIPSLWTFPTCNRHLQSNPLLGVMVKNAVGHASKSPLFAWLVLKTTTVTLPTW
ncbi:hypothetical protein NPIL_537191 [Nephila pilipes]|uniref:Uncharacterized protein n=1 Tax=Nephila pilipes TaxID=299642 RepID=A0A8X6TCZ2_NEPPI|nr:hypothetical protein NPIL_537191 [Nephila pilipes]